MSKVEDLAEKAVVKNKNSITVHLTKEGKWNNSYPGECILFPSKFTKRGNCSETTYNIDIRKYALTEDTNIYQIAYGSYKFYEDGNSSWKDLINTSEKENLIDVAFEMICWLKENNVL